MGRWSKRMKKYERHFLLGLVIILLVTFSIGGAFSCAQQGSGGSEEWSGSFRVTPGERMDLEDEEFIPRFNRYRRYLESGVTPSLQYNPLQFGIANPERGSLFETVWAHVLLTEAARAAGYRCGSGHMLQTAVRQAVHNRMGRLEFTDALYDQFLRDFHRQGAGDFQATVAEIAMKDQFLRPLVETRRYGLPYEAAYEQWKKSAEQVDLQYVAVRAADFGLKARQEELTRGAIGDLRGDLSRVNLVGRAIGRLTAQVESWRAGHDGQWPETLAESQGSAGAAAVSDPWGNEMRLETSDEGARIVSAGRDGEFGTPDDITPETRRHLGSLAALRDVGDALEAWHKATSEWPADLAVLKTPPLQGTLAPLKTDVQDGWENALHYVAPSEEGAAPLLASMGADGVAGTADDVLAVFEGDTVQVAAGSVLDGYLSDIKPDAWERDLRVLMSGGATWSWDVRSAGSDGVLDTEDDLTDGNQRELDDFFNGPEVRQEFELPARRRFQALWVHLPLLPDEVLAQMWEDFPELRPTAETPRFTEDGAFSHWRQLYQEAYYFADEPGDPETGHGAEQARRIAPQAPTFLIPDGALFGEPPADLVDENDPDRTRYLDGGWRLIVLRERFVDAVLNELLARARDRAQAIEVWDAEKEAFDAGAEGAKDPGERPAEITFETLLATELEPYLPGDADAPWIGFYETPEAGLTREEWEGLEHLGDINLTLGMQDLRDPGQFDNIPVVLNGAQTEAILRSVEYLPERTQELDEVRDQVFERYLEKRQLDRAATYLERLQRKVDNDMKNATDESAAEQVWTDTLAAFAADQDVTQVVESTGWFIGSRPPARRDPPVGYSENEVASWHRRTFVREAGYGSVSTTAEDGEGAAIGAFGLDVLKDEEVDGTASAYLVRVIDRRYPSPSAFSPRDYATALTREYLGDLFGAGPRGPGVRESKLGILRQALTDYLGGVEWLGSSTRMDLKTSQPIRRDEP